MIDTSNPASTLTESSSWPQSMESPVAVLRVDLLRFTWRENATAREGRATAFSLEGKAPNACLAVQSPAKYMRISNRSGCGPTTHSASLVALIVPRGTCVETAERPSPKPVLILGAANGT